MAVYVSVLGTLGKDAEMKASKKGDSQFLTFSLATNSGYGENKTTQWLSCSYFNTKLAPYLLKGKQVFVQGELVASPYLNKQGQASADLRVNVRNVELTYGEKEGGAKETHIEAHTPDDFKEDDIPF